MPRRDWTRHPDGHFTHDNTGLELWFDKALQIWVAKWPENELWFDVDTDAGDDEDDPPFWACEADIQDRIETSKETPPRWGKDIGRFIE